MMTGMHVLMEAVCQLFPQEWPQMLPIAEYILHTRPMGAHGLSAHDMSCAYGIASESDRILAPFSVPSGAPEMELCKQKFNQFSQL